MFYMWPGTGFYGLTWAWRVWCCIGKGTSSFEMAIPLVCHALLPSNKEDFHSVAKRKQIKRNRLYFTDVTSQAEGLATPRLREARRDQPGRFALLRGLSWSVDSLGTIWSTSQHQIVVQQPRPSAPTRILCRIFLARIGPLGAPNRAPPDPPVFSCPHSLTVIAPVMFASRWWESEVTWLFWFDGHDSGGFAAPNRTSQSTTSAPVLNPLWDRCSLLNAKNHNFVRPLVPGKSKVDYFLTIS